MKKDNKIAIKLKDVNDHQVLWEVFPRIEGHKFVITSTAIVEYSGPETYIFGSDEKGVIVDWCELPGSYRGDISHQNCLENIGYNIKTNDRNN